MTGAFTIAETSGTRYLEGPPESELLRKVDDVNLILENSFSAGVRSALLYAPNMTPRFFDLSSGDAGAILQKCRQYRLRVALVCPPGTVQFSTHFPELMTEENRLPYFRFFETADAAREWLSQA